MKKLSKRVISLVLSVLILASLCTVMLTVSAADGVTVYYRNSKNFGSVKAYYWSSASNSGAVQWPGVDMVAEGDNIYSIVVPAGNDMIIFNNGAGDQTKDLSIPGANSLYDGASNQWEEYNPGPKVPSISASKKDGSSFKSETLDVVITVNDADSAYYTVDGGAKKNFTGTATVTVGAGVAVDSTTTISVTATNANGSTTKTFTYTKKAASQGGSGNDGSTAPSLGGYFSTNPNGQVGKKSNITIDGSIADWDSSMLIAQGVANDDPRVYRPNSMYEIAMDDYALYAAWDNDNLYLMWEMANVQDAVAPNDTYPISQGNLWINNMPIFLYFSIDPSIEGDGSTTTDATVWNSGITLDAHIDTVLACSTNGSNGPFIYKANDDGKLVYNDTRQSAVKMMWGNEVISTELWGIDEGYGHYNNRVPGDVLDESSAWIDFYKDPEHSKSIDMFYEMSIPLDLLGTSVAELEANGIGLMKVSTFGTSGMNSLPADPSMYDNADLDYSGQEPNSREKEDADHITVPLARIGKMGAVNPNPNPNPNPDPDPEPEPDVTYVLGDADGDGVVSVMDSTTIQRHCASLQTITGIDKVAADVDLDEVVSVMDSTAIQRHMANFYDGLDIGVTKKA